MTPEQITAFERAREIVTASEWSGDMRVNMTTIIGAGRVLAKLVDELQATIAKPTALAALQAWVQEHKSHHIIISCDDGYGAPAFYINLYNTLQASWLPVVSIAVDVDSDWDAAIADALEKVRVL